MKIQNLHDVTARPVTMEGAFRCTVRWLLSAADGAPNFAMRQFEIEPGGYTPRHHHPYEHEVFVLEGEGEVWQGDTAHRLKPGDVVLVAPDEVHQFRNTGNGPFKFLCLIPNSAAAGQPATPAECSVVGRS
ncbi:MAG: carbohydrate-binding protein [Pirellulaceae bacterium]|nr:MAG: carbohydrate-binding protein [Pirellulaceae bacterium]